MGRYEAVQVPYKSFERTYSREFGAIVRRVLERKGKQNKLQLDIIGLLFGRTVEFLLYYLTGADMKENSELHPDRYGGDDIYETKKVAEHWHSAEMYRGWLVITIEKYCSRYGKKDDRLKEAYKIANYGRFLVEFEEKIAAGMNPEVVCKQIAEKIETEENLDYKGMTVKVVQHKGDRIDNICT